MKQKRKFGLSNQINLIFTAITFVTSVLFILLFRNTIYRYSKIQADKDFKFYTETAYGSIVKPNEKPLSPYYSRAYIEIDGGFDPGLIDADTYNKVTPGGHLIIWMHDDNVNFPTDFIDKVVELYSEEDTRKHFNFPEDIYDTIPLYNLNEYTYSVLTDYNHDLNSNTRILITISDNQFLKSFREPISIIISIGFVSLIVLGNAVILLWSSIAVERIKNLEREVSNFKSNNYLHKIKIEGNDEIAQLAHVIDDMREEICRNEEVKTEMLQNVTHDIKTPIAVITSYAEAIKDGVTGIEDIDVIIRQSEILTRKIKQLLEWNKLEYIIKDIDTFDEVDLGEVITNIVDTHKYRSKIRFEVRIDESTYYGSKERFYTMINNIIENSLRYAKTVIKVELKDSVITIFNDGEPISDMFLEEGFRPYEIGVKGQFGLGMNIVQKTVKTFNLKMNIENLSNGVLFTIEPNE